MTSMNKDNSTTGKRQRGQTTSRSVKPVNLVIIHLVKDVNTGKLALNLPHLQTSRNCFTHTSSPAGLFGTLGPGLRLRIFRLASTCLGPFRIHNYRGDRKLTHGPYDGNSLAQVTNVRALSAVSRAVRHEASTIFYKANSFHINHDPHRAGNDATSVLKRFREIIGEEAFRRIRFLGFVSLVTNMRASRMLPPPQSLEIQTIETLKAMIMAGSTHCLDLQSLDAKIEVCNSIPGQHSYRGLTIGDDLTGALEFNVRFRTNIELSLRLPACSWERLQRRWMEIIVEAEHNRDEVQRRGLKEILASMTTARERLRTLLPLQSRF